MRAGLTLIFAFLPLLCQQSLGSSKPSFQPLGYEPVPAAANLLFGGSFSPPTLAHMGIIAQLMSRFGFASGKMVVAFPYKKGAAPAKVSLGLTKIAVDHFDEVLEIDGIDYREFASNRDGRSSWTGRDGKRFTLEVEDYDIRAQNKSTLQTLEHLSRRNGARNNFWVSGGDSFASVPEWTPQWKEMFDHAHWIVISRPGFDQGEKAVSFRRENPLLGALGAEFLSSYDYSFDEINQIHVYLNKDRSKPGIFVVNQPSLEDSSSQNRKSLAEPGDHAHAQYGLQPSVFKESVAAGYYDGNTDAAKKTGYEIFTRRNLEIYLRWLSRQTEGSNTERLDPEMARDFRDASRALVALISANRDSRRSANENTRSGSLARLFGKSERELGHKRAARSSAVNDRELAPELIDYRNRLLRGDPDAIVARVELKKGLGLEGAPLTLNLVKSRLPRWLPLPIRRWDDRRVTWHDLNVSTNELRALIDDDVLTEELKKSAGHDISLFASILFTAVAENPGSRLTLELFASQRYFQRLHLGQIADELLDGFAAAERAAIQKLKSNGERFRQILKADQARSLAEIVSDLYAIARQATADPSLLSDDKFWTTVIDLMASRYPNRRFKPSNEAEFERMGDRLVVLASNLARLFPESFGQISYARRPLVSIEPSPRLLDPSLAARIRKPRVARIALQEQALANAVSAYVDLNREIFASKNHGDSNYEPLPASPRGVSADRGNLIWDMRVFDSEISRRFSSLDAAFEHARLYLETQPRHKGADKVFLDAREAIERQVAALRTEMSALESAWLKLKYPHQLDAMASDETKIEGYDRTVLDYDDLRGRFKSRLGALRTINQMMFGSVVTELNDLAKLREQVAEAIGPSSGTPPLGLSICERLLRGKRDNIVK